MAGHWRNLREEWRRFRADAPGRRFLCHHERARARRNVRRVAARIVVGTLFIAAGIVMWVTPGPGWLFVIFGLALLAGVSRRISRFMDAAEVLARRVIAWARRFWRGSSVAAKSALITLAAAVVLAAVAGLIYAAWRIWLAP